MPRKPTPVIDRLLPRCIEGESGCWLFQGALTEGYGVLGAGPRGTGLAYAHRTTYEFFRAEIPSGLDLDHLCRNRACCNPWHLEPVTRVVNANRGLRARGYRLPFCKNGHPYDEQNTRYRPGGQRRCLACMRARYRKALISEPLSPIEAA